MKFTRKISKRYWELKYLNWERLKTSRISSHPWVKNVLQYIYNFIYLHPYVQNVIHYIKYVYHYSDFMRNLLLFMRQDYNRILSKTPLYFLISIIICTFIALKLGGFFVFFFVFYCIFGSIFIYRSVASTWVKAYTKYGLNDFFDFSRMGRITRQKLLLSIMLRRKFILRKYKNKFYRKELFKTPLWNLCKTNFQDYTFNKKNIETIYTLFNKDLVLKHHITYYRINKGIDGRSKTLIEQNILKNYILSKKTFLSQIEHKLKIQNIIVGNGTLLIKKVYAKYFVYDHKTNSKILLSCYALCWETQDAICLPIVALGPWCIDKQEKKPWYVILERNVYHEAFLAGCPFNFYDLPENIQMKKFKSLVFNTSLKDLKKWKNYFKEAIVPYFLFWVKLADSFIGGITAFYYDVMWWYKKKFRKRGKSWRKREIRRLFYPYRKHKLKRQFKWFLRTLVGNPTVFVFLIFMELWIFFVWYPFLFLLDLFVIFLYKLAVILEKQVALHKFYGETIYTPFVEELYEEYSELFMYYVSCIIPEYAIKNRLLPGVLNLKKYPLVFLNETKRLIPIFIKEIYNQIKFVFSLISISSFYSLVCSKSENTKYKLKNQNKNNSQYAKAVIQKEYIPTYLNFWRKHYVRLHDRVINSFYSQNYPEFQSIHTFSWEVIESRFLWKYGEAFALESSYDLHIFLENVVTLRYVYYKAGYQSWWEYDIITELEFNNELHDILYYLLVDKIESEIMVNDLLTNEESLLLASFSKSKISGLELQDMLSEFEYVYMMYNFELQYQTFSFVPFISKAYLKNFYLPYLKVEQQKYKDYLQRIQFYFINQIDFATFVSVAKDMELVRTKHKHNTNGIKTLSSALKSNDLLWNTILSKFIIIELKSKIFMLESIIKDSCKHIYKIFPKNSNKTKIKVSKKKTWKKKYFKVKLDMLDTYVKNYTINKLNTSLQYFINNEKKRIIYIIPKSISVMHKLFIE